MNNYFMVTDFLGKRINCHLSGGKKVLQFSSEEDAEKAILNALSLSYVEQSDSTPNFTSHFLSTLGITQFRNNRNIPG